MINKIYVKTKKYIKENYKYILILLVTLFVSTYRLPFYIDSTGGLINTSKRVSIEGAKEPSGSFNMAYVNEIKATIPLWLISVFNKNWDVVTEKDITYGDMTVDEVIEYGRITMREGAKDAVEIAYKKAGLKVTESNNKTVVVYRDKEAETDLKVGDTIDSVNGNKITDFNSITNYVKNLKSGDRVTIKVTNNGKEYTRYAKMIEIEGEPKIGIVLLETREIATKPECNLMYKSAESGASGGLMTTLTIYDYLIKEDITAGRKIAGTGTIEKDGSVGEIAGIKYKLAGAVKKKVDLFLVPAGTNYKEAMKYKKENNYKINIVSVSTFDEAVKYLKDTM
jgi:PDZ domain-containing protein